MNTDTNIAIAQVIQKLQDSMPQLFGWAMKHNYVLAYADLFIVVVLTILVIISLKFNFRQIAIKEEYEDDTTNWVNIVVSIVVFAMIAIPCVVSGIERLYSPEMSSIQDIMRMIQ